MSPEPETDAMSEAVEAMCRVDWERIHPFPHVRMSWDEEHDETRAMYRKNNRALLAALLSPSVTDCETCGGTDEVSCREALCDEPGCIQLCTNPDCVDGQVTRPSLAVLRGELVDTGMVQFEINRDSELPTETLTMSAAWAAREWPMHHPEPLYLIASGGTDGTD